MFHGGWFMAFQADTLPPGNRSVVDVAGESILVTRDLGRRTPHVRQRLPASRGHGCATSRSSDRRGAR